MAEISVFQVWSDLVREKKNVGILAFPNRWKLWFLSNQDNFDKTNNKKSETNEKPKPPNQSPILQNTQFLLKENV